mgnify:CR=1 FL=1
MTLHTFFGQRVLVTGGSSEIGRQVCRTLAATGWHVVNLDRSPQPAEDRWTYRRVDMADSDALTQALRHVLADGPVLGLVNNVAAIRPASLEDTRLADFDLQLTVTARAALQCAQALIPGMRAAGAGRAGGPAARTRGRRARRGRLHGRQGQLHHRASAVRVRRHHGWTGGRIGRRHMAIRTAAAVARCRERRQGVPGVGHPIHVDGDPRVPALRRAAEAHGCFGVHWKMALAICDYVRTQYGRNLPLNAAGANAAILADMGLDPLLGRGLALIGRAAGLVAHAMEERREPIGQDVWNLVLAQDERNVLP